MYQATHNVTYLAYPPRKWQKAVPANANNLSCDWHMLREQLLAQWDKIEASDLDQAGSNPRRIAGLIARTYGISAQLVENYLRNFERTMPLPEVSQSSAM